MVIPRHGDARAVVVVCFLPNVSQSSSDCIGHSVAGSGRTYVPCSPASLFLHFCVKVYSQITGVIMIVGEMKATGIPKITKAIMIVVMIKAERSSIDSQTELLLSLQI